MDKICVIKLNDDYTVDKKGSRQSTWWKKGWKDYQPNSKVSKEIKNAIKRTYHTSPLTKSESKYLHAKLVVVDRKTALVGSANISKSALVSNYEIMLKVSGRAATEISLMLDNLRKMLEDGAGD